jgi:hypothetical protein
MRGTKLLAKTTSLCCTLTLGRMASHCQTDPGSLKSLVETRILVLLPVVPS